MHTLNKYLRYVWQGLSFLLVAYGFYLFFLFLLDTLIRINRGAALPISAGVTIVAIIFVAFFWYKKRRLPF